MVTGHDGVVHVELEFKTLTNFNLQLVDLLNVQVLILRLFGEMAQIYFSQVTDILFLYFGCQNYADQRYVVGVVLQNRILEEEPPEESKSSVADFVRVSQLQLNLLLHGGHHFFQQILIVFGFLEPTIVILEVFKLNCCVRVQVGKGVLGF